MKYTIILLLSILLITSCSNDPKKEEVSYSAVLPSNSKGLSVVNESKDTMILTLKDSTITVTSSYTYSYTTKRVDTVWKRFVQPGTPGPVDTVVQPPVPVGIRNNIILEANFEGSNPFSGLLDEKQYCCSYSITQGAIAHEGSGSFRAEVRKSDPSTSSGYRAELTKKSLSMTGDMWFGMSVYFQTPVTASGNWAGGYGGHFIQWHPSNSSGSASLAAWGSDGVWDICINPSGSGSVTHQNKVYTGGGALWKIKANKWYDVVWHINWTTGLVDVWIDGTLYAHYTGLNFNPTTYWKLGPNRWSMTNDWVIYYDNVRVARSSSTYTVQFKDVAPEGAVIP